MPPKVVNSSDFYVIEIDSEKNMLKSKWLRSVNCEEMKAGGIMLYEPLRDTGLSRVVANAGLLRNLDAETKGVDVHNFLRNAFAYELKQNCPRAAQPCIQQNSS